MNRILFLILFSVMCVLGIFLSEGHSQIRETGKPAMQCETNFDAMDTNHDGLVTKEQFLALPHHGRRNPEEAFKAMDRDNDGTLTREEFCAGKGGGRWGKQQSR